MRKGGSAVCGGILKGLRDTAIICAFPGCGKSYYAESVAEGRNVRAIDLDSRNFSKSDDFPMNYIESIKSKVGFYDRILVSTHKPVRDALDVEGLSHNTVYPKNYQSVRDEWIGRMYSRGDSFESIRRVMGVWDEFQEDIGHRGRYCDIMYEGLRNGEYLQSVSGYIKVKRSEVE